ncbi:MAG: class I SAM-dependent methyltransferase [Rubrivivax sp.]|nr:class I SAM-dependent methyltransferase [Rubrivivax sp.]
MDTSTHPASAPVPAGFDTTSHEDFYQYYKEQSLSPRTLQRFGDIAALVLRFMSAERRAGAFDVLDIGCGAGTQSRFWSDAGHRYHGVDINEPLIRLARERAVEHGRQAAFEVGSATALPFPDASFDISLMPELLEHVEDWQRCVDEAVRVLRPGGLLFLSTSSRLCPKQQEFNLPGYSWYPAFVKRYVVRRALSDWPRVANYAKYPAVHWFSFYQLRAYLRERGFESFDRFDIMRLDNKSPLARAVVHAIRVLPPLRFAGHVMTEGTMVLARKRGAPGPR